MTADRTAALEAAQRIMGGHARSLHPGSSDYFEAGDAVEVARALLSTAKEADLRAFGASDEACYRWPEGTPEHKALTMVELEALLKFVMPLPWSSSPEHKVKGFMAQIWDAKGHTVACIDAAADRSSQAQIIVAAVNALSALLSTAKEADRMREALRKLAIQSVGQRTYGLGIIHTGWTCELCKQDWDRGQPEKHDPDCAALLPAEGTKT